MNDFLMYSFKSALWMAVFYGIYHFFFRNETFFRFNRIFLFSGMIAAFVLPFFQLHYPVEIRSFSLPVTNNIPATIIPDTIPIQFDWTVIFPLIYIAGAFALFLYYGFESNKIRRLIRKQNTKSGAKPGIIYTSDAKSPFSFFGYVFMNPKSQLQDIEKELIMAHETVHVEQRHWIDILLAQLVCVLQWFNPFAWLCLNAVKQNHEFLADRSVIDKGYSPAIYQAALINSAFNVPVFTFANSFTSINKFKRITIMKKNISKPVKKLAVLLLLPALAGFLAAFAKPEYHYTVLPSQPETEAIAPQDTIKKAADSQSSAKTTTFKQAKTVQTKTDLRFQPPQIKESSGEIKSEVKPDTYTTCDSSQNVKVSGQVFDTDGKPIPGVAIVEVGGNAGTVTDMDGKFTLSVSADKDLKISYINKETVIIRLKSYTKGKLISTNMTVEMKDSKENPKQDEVRVVAAGPMKEKGFVRNINDSTLIYLRGDTVYTASKEQQDGKIRYRRSTSSPLIIIDGKESSATISDLNPHNIESISILKDESATSIYGEKGKNGVIIITTKKLIP